jgi:hypothetical protein
MSRLVKDLLIALLALATLGATILGDAEAATPSALKDIVCPGKPIVLKRLGASHKLRIDQEGFSQKSLVLKLQSENRKEQAYQIHASAERTIAAGNAVLRIKPSAEKGNCFEVV